MGRTLKGGGADAAEWKDKHSTGSVDGIQVPGDTSLADKWWQITVALGSIAFAYSYSYILLEMTVRPPPRAPPARRPCLASAISVPWKPSHVLHRCAAGLAACLCCAASASVHGMRPRAPTGAETRCALGAQDTVKAPENKPMRKAVGVSVWITTFFYIAIGIFGCAGRVGWHACHCSAPTCFLCWHFAEPECVDACDAVLGVVWRDAGMPRLATTTRARQATCWLAEGSPAQSAVYGYGSPHCRMLLRENRPHCEACRLPCGCGVQLAHRSG